MKKWRRRIGLGLLAVLSLAALWGYAYREEFEGLWERYQARETVRSISRYGKHLPPVDEVRVFRLEDKPGSANLGTFEVSYSEPARMYIVQEKTLTGAEAETLATRWRSLMLYPGPLAACYNPHHVIQFKAKGTLLAETVICFSCGNTTLPVFPGRRIVHFDSLPGMESTDYTALKVAVENLVGN